MVRSCYKTTCKHTSEKGTSICQRKLTKGRPLTTWLSMMTKQLSNDCKLTWDGACVKAQYRDIWKEYVKQS